MSATEKAANLGLLKSFTKLVPATKGLFKPTIARTGSAPILYTRPSGLLSSSAKTTPFARGAMTGAGIASIGVPAYAHWQSQHMGPGWTAVSQLLGKHPMFQAAGRYLNFGQSKQGEAELTAAGLAVKARDTGRVLMLQRAMSEDDPAAGHWEFPGGHIEPGEQPLTAAKREWREETGSVLPNGEVTGEWQSGIYKGHVWTIPEESQIAINLTGPKRKLNPDDPDQDNIEVVAWWDPKLIKTNPSIRKELRQSLRWALPAIEK